MTRRVRGTLILAGLVLAGAVVGLLLAPPSRSGRIATPPSPAATGSATGSLASLPGPASRIAIPRPRVLGRGSDVTRWAPVLNATVAHERPSSTSPAVVRVAAQTPEGTTNLVVADGETTRDGVTWVHARLAVLPDARTGWIPRRALGGWSFVNTRVVVDRAALTLTLYRAGRVIFHTGVGVGGPSTPTPAGQFYIRDRLTRFASPEYGPLAFGTSARSPYETDWPAGGFIGIHGTDQPDLIPGRVSHGCIRLTNRAILALGRLLPVGTPVTIR